MLRTFVRLLIPMVLSSAHSTGGSECPSNEQPHPVLWAIAGESWVAEEWINEDFAKPDWETRWVAEGQAGVVLREGQVCVDALSATEPGADESTLWYRAPLPTDVLIELTARVESPVEGNAANLNVIFHARELDGGAYRFGGAGRYREYQEIPNYIATLTGGFQEGWARLRRNPGFSLLSEDRSVRSEVDRTYRIRIMVAGGWLRYWLDGRLIHEVCDPRPIPGGWLGLRTWRSRIAWSSLRFAPLQRAGMDASTAHNDDAG